MENMEIQQDTPKRKRASTRLIKPTNTNYKEKSSDDEEEMISKKRKLQKKNDSNIETTKTKKNENKKKEEKSKKKKKTKSSTSKSTKNQSCTEDGQENINVELDQNEEESDWSDESNEELEEEERTIAQQLNVQKNDFRNQHNAFVKNIKPWMTEQLKFLSQNDEIDAETTEILEKHLPTFIACMNAFISNATDLSLERLNTMPNIYVKVLYKVFCFCVNSKKGNYDYDNFFSNDSFNTLLKDYIDYTSITRKRSNFPKFNVSTTNIPSISNEFSLGTVQNVVLRLHNLLKAFGCKVSTDILNLIKQINGNGLKEEEIQKARNYKETEILKWPFTPYDHNWTLEKFPIMNKKELTSHAFIGTMNYLGLRPSTALAILLKDVKIYFVGRIISHIMISLRHLKETSSICRTVCIPGNLCPIDVAGLITLYLDTRNVFERGLNKDEPHLVFKKEIENAPLFELHTTSRMIYEKMCNKIGTPRYAISAKSSRKGHCVMQSLKTKSLYPAMPMEMLEEDLISHGTWRTKTNMRKYLRGGCDQFKVTCELIEGIQPPPVTLDAKEFHVFLVDALEAISDWNISKDDESVKNFEKEYLKNGGKKCSKTTEYIREALSSVNFHKKVKLHEGIIPKIAIKLHPKLTNLEKGYKDGDQVFKKQFFCETCKGICIKENPALKEYDQSIFQIDKEFYYEKQKNNDFEVKMAQVFAPQNENQRECLTEMFKKWSLEKNE
uniref:Uncharacterized protein n=1 Tax=Panagrolaimus sp. ES5 TaxID=591445 RepID=A0AC34GUS8_9BILA